MKSQSKITISRCHDAALIDSVSAELEPYLTWDQANKLPKGADILSLPECIVVSVCVDGVVRGLGVLNGSEVHTLFLPSLRGKLAIEAGKKGLAWFFEHTKHNEITSYAFSHRPEVVVFAKLCGMEETHIDDPGFTYDGNPIKRHNFKIERQ